MLRNKKNAVLAAVMALAVLAPLAANSAVVVTNTGTANYENEWTAAQAPASGSTEFLVASNPALTVVKTHNVTGKKHSGDTVTFEIKVTYPKVVDSLLLCGDDSAAVNTVITDALPAAMAKVNNTVQISTDNGTTFTNLGDATDAVDGLDASGYNVSFVGANLSVVLGTIAECTEGASAIIIRFQATVI